MSSLTAPEVAYCCLVLVLSFAIRGGIGFGAAALPLIALVLPMKLVVPVFTVLGIFSSWSIVFNDRRHVEWREFLRLLAFTLVGAVVGLFFFHPFYARPPSPGRRVRV